ncbi:hypothetical protein CDO44_07670 [Pigmentiphaga sp. NML080357]|uniref:FecR domain-containing protein n=1 Tax=Pigmentiphaga sp. NML080357 TaxID=2008675 RepID=UPI000B411DCF|nr:FecR domain-containing protein [Pigmentiphaga sp. NML080357]OVZ60600.1 hypothetical protein CDO44_07670 [Pigmentiphaga sp. NML080357]
MNRARQAPPVAGDDPVGREAIARFALLCSGAATPADREAVRRWRMERPEHERAWQRLESLRQTLSALPHDVAAPTLRAASARRRAVLKSVAALAGTGVLAYGSHRIVPWREWIADYRTPTGGFDEIALADGTRIALDTASAIDVRYTGTQRLVRLLAGQILIATAPHNASEARPFTVLTDDGAARPLGTHFTARKLAAGTRIAVYEGKVELQPVRSNRSLIVPTGQAATFSAAGLGTLRPADESALAWREGSVAALDWRLEDLLAELGRYRSGYLGCDPAVADIRVSGTYPVRDTDKALAVLAQSFPIRMRTMSRYWVRVEPR